MLICWIRYLYIYIYFFFGMKFVELICLRSRNKISEKSTEISAIFRLSVEIDRIYSTDSRFDQFSAIYR